MYKIIFFTLSLIISIQVPSIGEEPFKVGVAKIDITPDYPIRLNGFGFRRAESEGVGQRIYAKALAIQFRNESPVILLTVDSLGVRLDMVDRLHKRLSEEHAIPRKNIALTFTHSHCAPKVDGASDTIFSTPIPAEHQKRITRYTKELEDKLVSASNSALKNIEPAKLSWGNGSLDFAVNRRTRGGPVDHNLPVLFVESPDGKVRAVFTTYACHCVTLSYNKIHGDWAGTAAASIERIFGNSVGLVSIGLGSDSNPNTGVTGGDEKAAERLGLQLATEVKRVYEKRKEVSPASITTSYATISLDFKNTPTKSELEAVAKKGGPAGHNAGYQLEKLKSNGKLPSQMDYPIQTVGFGDQLSMIFLAGEVCVDYAIELRKELDRNRVWFHGYSNDFCAYIPSERLVKEGGYGGGAEIVYFGLPSTLKGGLEKKIISQVVKQVDSSFHVPDGTRGSLPKKPIESIKEMKVTNDLDISVVVAEPVIRDPVYIDFGFAGEVYVVEMPNYAQKVDGSFEQKGVVKRLVDNDGDGFYESHTEFMTGLRFPTGVKVWKKGVLVCDAPNILYAEDTDNDGMADKTEVLLSGFATHNPHARVNALSIGLDGWLYGSGGLFGGVIKTRSGKTVDLRNRDFRWKPDTDELEPATGVSQQGRVRDDWDQWYGCDNGTLVKYFPVEDRYTRRNPHIPSIASQLSPLQNPADSKLYPNGDLVLFKLSGAPGRPTSVCGLGIYRDQVIGSEFYGNTFSCEPVNQLIHRRRIDYSTGTSVAVRAKSELSSEFLTSSDQWFRPVQVKTGPDGCLWVVDMYRYVIEHPRWIPESTKKELNVFAGTELGRIYRIGSPRHKLKLNFHSASDDQLLEFVKGSNGTVRDLASEFIVWENRKDLATKLIQGIEGLSAPAKAQVLSVAYQLGQLDEKHLLKMMQAKEPLVQYIAIRFAENYLDSEQVLSAIIRKTNHENPFVAKQACWVLGNSDDERASIHLATMWKKVISDNELRYAVLSSIKGDAKSHWRHMLFETAISELEKEYLRPSLLTSVVADASTAQWEAMFQDLWRRKKDLVSLVFDPRFAALTNHLPGQGFSPTAMDQLGDVFEFALSRLQDEKTPLQQVPHLLAVLSATSRKTSKELSEILQFVDSKYPVEYQKGVIRMIVEKHRELWLAVTDKLDQCTHVAKSAAIEGWLNSESGREFLFKQLKVNSNLKKWLTNEHKNNWISKSNENQRKELYPLFRWKPRNSLGRLVAEYGAATKKGGNSSNGKLVFDKHCSACHRLGNQGKSLGPDLVAVTNKSRESLLTSILDPSADVDARYRSIIIDLVNGQQVSGLITNESSSSLTIQLNEKESRDVLRKDIERIKTSDKSFMPEGLNKEINYESMNDLLAFLMSNRMKRKVFPGNEPKKIKVAADKNEVLLPASAAEIYGKQILFEAQFKNVGYWHDQSDLVVWNLDIEEAGEYQVELTYSCDATAAGNVAVVIISSGKLEGKVVSTGGWANYKAWKLGKLSLAKRNETISVVSKMPVKGALMDLQSIKLIKVPQ